LQQTSHGILLYGKAWKRDPRRISFGPGLMLVTTFDLPAYAEQAIAGSNAFALAYGAKSVTDPRSELGFCADKSYAMQDGVLTLRGRLAWAHDYDTDRSIGATFQTLPGASFVVNGAAQVADTALTTAAAEMRWRRRLGLRRVRGRVW
jgi:uncharacterized protein with beta-barrel porin domain